MLTVLTRRGTGLPVQLLCQFALGRCFRPKEQLAIIVQLLAYNVLDAGHERRQTILRKSPFSGTQAWYAKTRTPFRNSCSSSRLNRSNSADCVNLGTSLISTEEGLQRKTG